MNKSEVYFTDTREHFDYNIYNKIKNILSKLKIKQNIKKGDLVAIKLHFGEYGNTAYIRPNLVRIVVEEVKKLGAKPFLTDGSTLYKGSRSDSVTHLETAVKNGFAYAVVDAPIIIADGLSGKTCTKVKVNGKHFETVEVGSEVYNADYLIVLTHFKLHVLTGIGGSIKNISMGLASKAGKLSMHSSVKPNVHGEKCIKCLRCKKICPKDAFEIKEKSVKLIEDKCIGCGECISVCPVNAIKVVWNSASDITQEKMADYAAGVLKNKKNKTCFLNFLYHISPECDCFSHADTPFVPDIGILGSEDIVAVDQASAELVNQQEGLKNTALKSNYEPGTDKIKTIYPDLDWQIQINAAEKLGLGTKEYNLNKIK